MKFIKWIAFVKNRCPNAHTAKLNKSIDVDIQNQVKKNFTQNSKILT